MHNSLKTKITLRKNFGDYYEITNKTLPSEGINENTMAYMEVIVLTILIQFCHGRPRYSDVSEKKDFERNIKNQIMF